MNILWFFYFYSFLGFLLEVAYARAIRLDKLDRKCRLLLPICPVYGIGATAITLLPQAIQNAPVFLFFAGAAIATLAEYSTALFYEKIWRVKFWDYAALPGNLHGRVCIPFSLIWGGLSLPLCYYIHPIIATVTAALPNMLLLPITLIFLVDLALTGRVLRRTRSTEALRWYLV